jgi:hypothetical protein
MTPLGPTDWRFKDSREGPSLWPSIGNWQLPCRSHYIIRNGQVIWARAWTEEEVKYGRAREKKMADAYYRQKYSWRGVLSRILSATKHVKKGDPND